MCTCNTFVCIHTYIYIYIYICMCTCIYIYVYVYRFRAVPTTKSVSTGWWSMCCRSARCALRTSCRRFYLFTCTYVFIYLHMYIHICCRSARSSLFHRRTSMVEHPCSIISWIIFLGSPPLPTPSKYDRASMLYDIFGVPPHFTAKKTVVSACV